MCFNAFDKAANLDVLDHPVLNFIYYLVSSPRWMYDISLENKSLVHFNCEIVEGLSLVFDCCLFSY